MFYSAAPKPVRIWRIPRPGRLVQYIRARLNAPEIDLEQVDWVLRQYGLTQSGAPRNLSFGWRNRNIVTPTGAGKKVLKQYRGNWQEEAIVYEHAILKQLESLDFPAPRLNPTLNGNSLVKENGRFYALFDFVAGDNYTGYYMPLAQRQKLIALAGAALARFHQAMSGFVPQGQHHLGFAADTLDRQRDIDWHLNVLDLLRRQPQTVSDPQASVYTHRLIEMSGATHDQLIRLEETLQSAGLPRQVIHGDYGLHNLLFQHDGAVTVHDFELARIEWRLVDLVIVLARMGLENGRAFLSAYQAVNPLSEAEWHYLPQVWQYYRLRGAVQSWQNYHDFGDLNRLKTAQKRFEQADWALNHAAELEQIKWATSPPAGEQPVRVMMVVRLFYPWVGGAERQAHKLAQALQQQDVQVELVTGWWYRGAPQQEIIDGIPVFRNQTLWEFFGIKGLRKFGGYLYIASLIWFLWRRRADYDLIHVHGLNVHTFAAVLAGRWFNCKVIVKLANSGAGSDILKMRRGQQLALSRLMLPTALQADRFVALNNQIVQELTAVGVQPANIVAIPNGVESHTIAPKTDYSLHAPPRLIFVGRLHAQKGIDMLLHAVKLLAQQLPNIDLNVQLFGTGPLQDELEELAHTLDVTRLVTFGGQTDLVIKQLQQADIFVLPSRAEGLSNALLEAMACGLPVIASDIPGNSGVIKSNYNGLLFSVDNPESLAEKMQFLLQQHELRRQLGHQARQTVEKQYSLDAVAERYLAQYRELLAQKKSLPSYQVKQI